ncbi:MAG: diacylglycerol kinase family protein [Oscillospiraceae bacterium]|jgi:diacylglycerol kinase|nr:diacylglycerol kinase family protein [Oscillospiraceae bacterium]
MEAVQSFFRSFAHAARGVAVCLRRERNLRFHVAVGSYMYGFLLAFDWFRLSRTDWALLFLSTALVIGAELMNSALERAVDLASPQRHPLAKLAKDAASGAVLVCAAGAVAVGIAVLWQPAAFRAMADYYWARPGMLAVLGISGILAGLFVFYPKSRKSSIHPEGEGSRHDKRTPPES